jgi:hypothetical protein
MTPDTAFQSEKRDVHIAEHIDTVGKQTTSDGIPPDYQGQIRGTTRPPFLLFPAAHLPRLLVRLAPTSGALLTIIQRFSIILTKSVVATSVQYPFIASTKIR